MRVIGQEKLKCFTDAYEEHKASLQSWLAEVKAQRWTCSRDIESRYKHVQVTDSDMVTFVMGKGAIRVVSKILFRNGIIRIDEVGKSVKQTTDSEKLAGKK